MTDATIEVLGEATVHAEPELARVHITVEATRDTRSAALAEVTRRAAALDEVFAASPVPTDDRADGPFSVDEEYGYVDGARVLDGYRGSRRTVLVIDDWSALLGLLIEASERADARVAGPWFELRADSAAYDDARRAASADARRRARAYCTGLGIELGAVLSAQEPGVHVASDHGPSVLVERASYSPNLDPVPELVPGTVDVTASIAVCFSIAPR